MTDKILEVSEAVDTLEAAVEQGLEPVEVDRKSLAVPVQHSDPWERRDSETDFQWEAFRHYRDSGLGRTYQHTFQHLQEAVKDWPVQRNGQKLKGSLQRVREMASEFDWKERCYAFDREEERLYQLARSEAVREMAKRHETVVTEAISSLMVPISALQKAVEDDPEFVSKLSKTDVKKLIDLANRSSRTIPSLMAAERLARGMPTEIIGGTVEHQHIISVERDQIGEVLEVLADVGIVNGRLPGGAPGEIIDAEVVEFHPVPAEGDE